jgi:hypothetical protein
MSLTILPTAGQSLNVTRDPIRNNFTIINTDFPIDHAPWNDTTNNGKHFKVTLPVQAAAPAFSAGDIGFYNFPVSAHNELFIHKQTISGTADIAFTQSTLSTYNPSIGEAGWTYLPSGIILNWGTGVSNAVGVGSVTFSKQFPTAVLNVQFTIYTGTTPATSEIFWTGASTTTASCLTAVNGTIAALGFSYLAIGY